jgi:hypothetical protein
LRPLSKRSSRLGFELENPELTWLKPELFNEAKHRIGDFKSVDAPDALKRISEHCVPEAKLIAKLHVTALARMRNRIAHFGLTEKRAAVEVLTTPVLDFLVTFVHDDLLALVPEEQSARAADILERVRPSMGKVQALVDTRLQPARELKAEGSAHILPCPICAALSVPIMGGEETIACVVCHTDLGTPTDAAWEYAGTSEYAVVTDGGDYPVFEHEGFYCGGAATHVPGEAVDGVENPILLCLTCGEECVGVCSQCGRAVTTYGLDAIPVTLGFSGRWVWCAKARTDEVVVV